MLPKKRGGALKGTCRSCQPRLGNCEVPFLCKKRVLRSWCFISNSETLWTGLTFPKNMKIEQLVGIIEQQYKLVKTMTSRLWCKKCLVIQFRGKFCGGGSSKKLKTCLSFCSNRRAERFMR